MKNIVSTIALVAMSATVAQASESYVQTLDNTLASTYTDLGGVTEYTEANGARADVIDLITKASDPLEFTAGSFDASWNWTPAGVSGTHDMPTIMAAVTELTGQITEDLTGSRTGTASGAIADSANGGLIGQRFDGIQTAVDSALTVVNNSSSTGTQIRAAVRTLNTTASTIASDLRNARDVLATDVTAISATNTAISDTTQNPGGSIGVLGYASINDLLNNNYARQAYTVDSVVAAFQTARPAPAGYAYRSADGVNKQLVTFDGTNYGTAVFTMPTELGAFTTRFDAWVAAGAQADGTGF